jgi:penicillin-binding protein 1A
VRGKRRLLAFAVAVAALVALGAGIRVALASAPVQSRLRARAQRVVAERLPRAHIAGAVSIDARLRLVAEGIILPARRPDAPPTVVVRRAVVRPRISALLRGRFEPSWVALEGVHVQPGPRLEELAALVEELSHRDHRTGLSSGTSADGRALAIDLTDVTASLTRAGTPPLDVGPLWARLHISRDPGGPAIEWRAGLPGQGRGRGTVRLRVANGGGEAAFAARFADVWARGQRLASERIGPLAFAFSGTLRWDRAAHRAELADARLDLCDDGRATVAIDAALDASGDPSFELRAHAGGVDWKELVATLPRSLQPPPAAPAVAGKIRGALAIAGPLRRPAAWRVDVGIDTSGLVPAGGAMLDRPFRYIAHWASGRTREVEVGPANPSFVPVGALPPHVVRAVLASEDAAFFVHKGFDVREIQEALARPGARRRLRGASTITQQLAKNLYLSPERTLARKAREAFATIALETSVGKRRLLEIYLNVAEWGEGVVGIGEAARHWFAKDARELSPKEAAFLASVIPNPVRYEMYRRRGALTEAWEARVRDLLVKLRATEALSDEQFYEAWDAPLVFARG